MRGFRPQWMRMTSAGMGYPMTIAYNCYIDLDATDSTLLFRAAKVMEWVAWPHNAVSVTYGQPISPPPAAVVAKMLVKQAMGKSPTPAPVTATEKPIEPPGVTPTESAEGGHAGRVTLPHGSGDIETDLSGHAGRVTVGHVIVDARERVERIGAYAKREIYSALAENRVPNDDFERLLTLEGTKELLGASLTTCPLFSYSRMMRCGDQNGCWTDPSMRDGREVFVNSQWYNGHRKKLECGFQK